MNATITAENKTNFLLIESQGDLLNTADLFEHCRIVFAEIAKHGLKKVLINEPQLNFPRGLFQYYDLVMQYVNNFPPELRYLKLAVVMSKDYKEIADFWETVSVNHGFEFFTFDNYEEAHTWLLT
ncbi:MAG: hypothetical protein Q7T76_17955 [Ferruginibacter sp.]|nr:hypothetical protein [Ferruginibacter sp.]